MGYPYFFSCKKKIPEVEQVNYYHDYGTRSQFYNPNILYFQQLMLTNYILPEIQEAAAS
jgi:hypothetical protein